MKLSKLFEKELLVKILLVLLIVYVSILIVRPVVKHYNVSFIEKFERKYKLP